MSKFILSKHLKMNLSINKHLQLDNFVYDKKEIEIKNKTNNSHSKDNSKKFESKKPLLITCEYKYTNNQNLIKKNYPNRIIKYNPIFTKKKRHVSLSQETIINKSIRNNSQKKINHIQKHKITDLSERENSILSNLNQYEYIKSNSKSKEKNWISFIQSKTQRAREYSMRVKQINIGNSINHNSRDNKNSSTSKSKSSISKSKKKIKGRSNSNVSFFKPNLLNNISFWSKKINLNEEKKKKDKSLNQIDKNKKSRNFKSDNNNMFFKSGSIENNKKNILSSSSLSININTAYNQKDGNYRFVNNKTNKKCFNKNYNKFINNNANDALGTNYAEIYIKKNMLKNSFDNNKNFSISNKNINHKPLIYTKIKQGKINSYKN